MWDERVGRRTRVGTPGPAAPQRSHAMLANYLIFGFCVTLVVSFITVVHCTWLGNEPQD